MKYDNLYEQFKRKQYQKQLIEQSQLERIKTLSSGNKINSTSNKILLQKFILSFEQFKDEQMISLDQSIPILYSTGIFKVLSSMQDAQEKMNSVNSESEIQHSRLKSQAKFVYFLWKMIDQEEIPTKMLKQILTILYERQNKIEQMYEILNANFRNKDDIQMVIQSWKLLNQDKHYYSSTNCNTKSNNSNFGSVSSGQKGKRNHAKQLNHNQSFKNKTAKLRLNPNTEQHEHHNIQNKGNHQNQHSGLKISQELLRKQIQFENHYRNVLSQCNHKDRKNSDLKHAIRGGKQEQANQNQNPFQVKYEMTVEKTKELVQRLYRPQMTKIKQQRKRQKDQQKLQQQLQACTFKPKIQHSKNRNFMLRNKDRDRGQSLSTLEPTRLKEDQRKTRINSSIPKATTNNFKQNESIQGKPIKGYQKTVQRLRTANQRKIQQQQLRQHKGTGQNYEKLKQKGINPPKFLTRKKQEQQILFMIEFDLGRHKVKVKVLPSSTQEQIAKKLCQIYSLKSEYYQKICEIVRAQLEQYYLEQERLFQ